ncbi:MAG: hypothetical protein GY951_02565 [Psychromonas sp.]|nr:hypothetical protein [Alteromonadales bacterium]MCP5076927.1 hypothetical protein [Psychromonas sp.]
MFRLIFIVLLSLSSFPLFSAPYKVNLTPSQAEQLGLLIWKNEGKQQIRHLTTWNRGEDFPSLGLGHFIWYPTAEKGPFKEQFPQFIEFMQQNSVVIPQWLLETDLAPWSSREQFYEEFNEPKLTELRLFLSEQLELQVRFIVQRLEKAIPLIFEDSPPEQQKVISKNLQQLSTPEGIFTLLDYVNFKGEGVNEKERYQGEGWGLKQVLLAMPVASDDPLRSFGLAADEMLTRRVKNAPRDEFRWLKGWRVRVHGYKNLNIK